MMPIFYYSSFIGRRCEKVFKNIRSLNVTDAVLITIGTKQKNKTTLFSDMAKAVVSAAEEINYDRPILVVSGFGVGNSYNYLGSFMKMIINLFLKDQYKDKQLMETIFSQSNLKCEMVQAGILNNNPFTGKYKVFSRKGMKVGKF